MVCIYHYVITLELWFVYVMPLGFEDDPTAVRTFDASGEEAGWL